jgi:hypothetical protein
MTKRWRCWFGWHKRVRRHGTTDPNAKVCVRCGKEHNIEGWAGGLPLGDPFRDR